MPCCKFRVRVGHALDGVHHGMVRVGWGEGASNSDFPCRSRAESTSGDGVSVGAGAGVVSGWNAGFDIVFIICGWGMD